ncbi:Tnks [Symbiodinium sp. CCMP2592]|nr:Tnks [Symbiodinium sp. CCMP2592]
MIAPTAFAVFCKGHPDYWFRLDDVIDRVIASTIDFNTWESAWEGISCCREQVAAAAVQTDPISAPIPLQRPQWEYLDGDKWRPAAEEFTVSLEHAHNAGHSSCEVSLGHHIYDVDVEKYSQRNRATGVGRRLRRVMVVDGDATVNHLRIIHALQQEQISCLSKQLSEQHALSQQFFELVAAGTKQMERVAKHLSEQQELSRELSRQKTEDQEQIKRLSQQLSEQQAFDHTQVSEQKAADQEQIRRLSKQLSEQQSLSQALSENRAVDNSKIKHLCEQLCKQRALAERLSKQKAEELRCLSQHLSEEQAQCQQLSEQKAEYQEQNRRLSQQLSKQQLLSQQLSEEKAAEQEQVRILAQQLSERKAVEQQHLRSLRQQLTIQLLSRLPDVDTASPAGCGLYHWDVPALMHSALCSVFVASMTRHRESLQSDQFCDPPQVEITRIREIMNPYIQGLYRHAREGLARSRPAGCEPPHGISAFMCDYGHVNLNEYLLFHGCPSGAVDSILEKGLDPQRGGEAAGNMFGTGAYFAENASKSDFYTTCSECSSCKDCKHPQAERCILVVRVLLGETKVVTAQVRKDYAEKKKDFRSWKRAPEGCDSVTAENLQNGGVVDHREFVVYKEQQSLVRWLIYYRHKSDCECHNCKYRRS